MSATPVPGASFQVIPYVADAKLLQVTVPGLRMRASAGTKAEILRSLSVGEVVRVLSGPVDADAYSWYEVVDLDSRIGWVAMGGGTQPWLSTVPGESAPSPLLLRLERACDVGIRDFGAPVPADIAISADGRVVLITGAVRQLNQSGMARVRRDALQLPALQETATYQLERLPGAAEPPGHGACTNSFTLGEGSKRVSISAMNWQGDQEEATYYVPSPERRALDDLAIHLSDVEAWLGPTAWSDPVARPYVSHSYLFRLEPPSDTAPPGVESPSVVGVSWPFEGPIEGFGEAAVGVHVAGI
jgi:hypothetical protein